MYVRLLARLRNVTLAVKIGILLAFSPLYNEHLELLTFTFDAWNVLCLHMCTCVRACTRVCECVNHFFIRCPRKTVFRVCDFPRKKVINLHRLSQLFGKLYFN